MAKTKPRVEREQHTIRVVPGTWAEMERIIDAERKWSRDHDYVEEAIQEKNNREVERAAARRRATHHAEERPSSSAEGE